MIFNGSVAVRRGESTVRAGGRVTLLTLTIPRGVEFLERRINKSTDER